jgi:hypothetical protein
MIDGMPMDLHWSGEFFIGDVQGLIWAEAFVYEEHDDGKMDDVEIKVYGGDGSSLPGAEVFVDGATELYGETDHSGSVRFYNLSNGYYSADISYCGIGYGNAADIGVIHDPSSEMPTMDKISVEITYPNDNHKFTQHDDILIIEGTADTSIQGDYIENVVMLIPGGESDNNMRSDDMFMEYTKVPTKPIGSNGSFSKWRFEVPDNPLNSENPDDRPPLDVAIPLYARAFDDKGGWNQAKINVVFTLLDNTTSSTRGRQSGSSTESVDDMPSWLTNFYDVSPAFDDFKGSPTNIDLKLTVKPDELMKTGRLVGTFSEDISDIELYFTFFIDEYIEWNGKTFPDGAWTNWVHMDDVEEFCMMTDVELKSDGTWVWSPPDEENSMTRQSSINGTNDDGGPELVKVGVVGYDSNGSFNYIVSDQITIEDDDDNYEDKGEAWTHVDFFIGETGFIFAKAYITADDSDGKMDDVEIKVFDANQNPIEGAEIYIWDTYIGDTDKEGSIRSHDETQGLDDGYYPVNIIFRGLFECPKCSEEFDEALGEGDSCPACEHPISELDLMVYRAETDFIIGTSAVFIKVNAYVKDIDSDGRSDDVAIKVQDLKSNPIKNAKVFIDDKFIGKTDEDGYIKEFNLNAGRHTVDVLTEDWYTGFTDFFSEGNGESYIYAEAFVLNMVSIGIAVPNKNDVLIYVYDKYGSPLRDAEIYFNGIYQGQTTIQGFLSMFDQPEGWYAIDVFWFDDVKGKEYHGYTECKSEGNGDDYIYSDNIVDDIDENGYPDDGIIVVYDSNGEAVEGARVKIDGEHIGNTSSQGGTRSFISLGSRGTNLQSEDLSAGWHTITVEYDEVEPFTGEINTIESTRVIKSDGKGEDYIYANAFVADSDNDGNKNDVKIVVSNNFDSPVINAEIILNYETFKTDSNGLVTIYDLAEGRHEGKVTIDDQECSFTFESMGDGGGNQIPTIETTMPDKDLKAGNEYTFTAQIEDFDGDRVVCIWNFEDGTPDIIGTEVTHTFSEMGDYKITVTASDGIDRITYNEKIKVEAGADDVSGGGQDGITFDSNMTLIIIIAVIALIIILAIVCIVYKHKRGKTDDDEDKDDLIKDGKEKAKDGGIEKKKPDKESTLIEKIKTKNEPTANTEVVVKKSSFPLVKPTMKNEDRSETEKLKKESDDVTPKRYELYRAALKQAYDDGVLTDGEKRLLAMLRKKYSISEDEHNILATEINFENDL